MKGPPSASTHIKISDEYIIKKKIDWGVILAIDAVTHIKISDEYVIKKKTLIKGVIAGLGQFCPQPLFYSGIFTVYFQLLCEISHTYKDKWWIRY